MHKFDDPHADPMPRMVADSIKALVDECSTPKDQLRLFTTIAGTALFGMSENYGPDMVAQWLRDNADHFDGLAIQQRGEMN